MATRKRNPKQDWSIGATVKVGRAWLIVEGIEPSFDGDPPSYLLRSTDGQRFYRFAGVGMFERLEENYFNLQLRFDKESLELARAALRILDDDELAELKQADEAEMRGPDSHLPDSSGFLDALRCAATQYCELSFPDPEQPVHAVAAMKESDSGAPDNLELGAASAAVSHAGELDASGIPPAFHPARQEADALAAYRDYLPFDRARAKAIRRPAPLLVRLGAWLVFLMVCLLCLPFGLLGLCLLFQNWIAGLIVITLTCAVVGGAHERLIEPLGG